MRVRSCFSSVCETESKLEGIEDGIQEELETTCISSVFTEPREKKKKKGSNWRASQASLQKRVRNENYPGQLGRHL